MAIVFLHIGGAGGVPKNIGFALGQGVSFFFVLSGFVLFYNYPTLPDWSSRWRFMIRRFVRLWPAHVVGIAFTVYVEWAYYQHTTPLQMAPWFLANLAMVQTWFPFHPYTASINGPSWSIAVEFWLYLMFLLITVDFARRWWIWLGGSLIVACLLIGIATVFSLPWATLKGVTDSAAIIYYFPPARLFEFVLGMSAGLAFRRIGRFSGGKDLAWTLIEVAAIILVIAEMRLIRNVPPTPLGWWLGQTGIAIPASLLLFVMAQGRGHISRALSVSPMVFLGEISYSIYLVHVPLGKLYFIIHKGAVPEWAGLAGYLAILFTMSALVFWLIEQPARWLVRNRRGNPSRLQPEFLLKR